MKRSMFSNRERREQRQLEAQERNTERAKRSPEQQLAVLEARGVTTGREVDRLKGAK